MTLRLQGISRRDLTDVSAGDTLHAVEVNKGHLPTRAPVRRDFQSAEIRHAMPDMYGRALALHPADVTGLFINWCNVHIKLLSFKTDLITREFLQAVFAAAASETSLREAS